MVAVVFLAIAAPLLRETTREGFDTYDERTFHLPTIRSFMDDWPAFDLVHMRAHMSPLYHAALATVGVGFGLDVFGLRVVNLLLSLACLWVIHAHLARRPSGENALLVTAAVALSPYFLGSSVRLMTDNMALLFAVSSIAAMEARGRTTRDLVGANTLILLAVLTRQSYAWLAGVYLASVGDSVPPFDSWKAALGRAIRVLLPLSLPIVGLAALAVVWGGMTPPGFRDTPTFSTDAPIFVISLLGAFGCFLVSSVREMQREARVPTAALATVAVGCALILILHPVSNEYPLVRGAWSQRGGWLWLAASRTPDVLSTASLFWVLFPFGAVCAAIMVGYARTKNESLWAPCLVLLVASSVLMPWTYQKYFEPLLLVWLGQLLGHGEGWRFRVGPSLLVAAFAVMSFSRYFA
ncbi:MAG: hypothetical protein ACREQJ_18385 [Candidatus Binatia bacterium]